MMEQEFQDLINMFSKVSEGKVGNVADIVKESVGFFEKIKDTMKNATPEEKMKLTAELNQMHAALQEQAKGIYAKIGMTEEQVLAMADKPQLFSPDQWNAIQDAKQQLVVSGQDINRMISQPTEPQAPVKEKAKKAHKFKRDTWQKS
jgi:hypothetical protein